jgi:sarcosine oxidase subunit delta
MQIFVCPFCGPRDETEFHYGGEAGNARPEGHATPAGRWAEYLHMRKNPKGRTDEIWVHLPCREFFMMTRDSLTHAVIETRALGTEPKA